MILPNLFDCISFVDLSFIFIFNLNIYKRKEVVWSIMIVSKWLINWPQSQEMFTPWGQSRLTNIEQLPKQHTAEMPSYCAGMCVCLCEHNES